VDVQGGQRIKTRKWIEITYGRPIKRGRQNLFGAGADYGKKLSDGSPVWRAGANQTTRFKTELALELRGEDASGRRVHASSWNFRRRLDPDLLQLAAQEKYDRTIRPRSGLLRVYAGQGRPPYSHEVRDHAVLDGSIYRRFVDMTADGGKLAMMWDRDAGYGSFKRDLGGCDETFRFSVESCPGPGVSLVLPSFSSAQGRVQASLKAGVTKAGGGRRYHHRVSPSGSQRPQNLGRFGALWYGAREPVLQNNPFPWRPGPMKIRRSSSKKTC